MMRAADRRRGPRGCVRMDGDLGSVGEKWITRPGTAHFCCLHPLSAQLQSLSLRPLSLSKTPNTPHQEKKINTNTPKENASTLS